MQAVSGDFVSQTFSPETGNFLLSFIARTKLAHAPSLIYLNEEIHYPNGFTVRWLESNMCSRLHAYNYILLIFGACSVSPSGAAVYSTIHNTVELSLSETVMDGQVRSWLLISSMHGFTPAPLYIVQVLTVEIVQKTWEQEGIECIIMWF